MSDANAKWMYDNSHVGDVVVFVRQQAPAGVGQRLHRVEQVLQRLVVHHRLRRRFGDARLRLRLGHHGCRRTSPLGAWSARGGLATAP